MGTPVFERVPECLDKYMTAERFAAKIWRSAPGRWFLPSGCFFIGLRRLRGAAVSYSAKEEICETQI